MLRREKELEVNCKDVTEFADELTTDELVALGQKKKERSTKVTVEGKGKG